MARRIAYGNEYSENGWPMVDTLSCQWILVPGTEKAPVYLQIQEGAPLWLLRAWAADWHAHIEPLRNDDSACWTLGNDVGSSNHLSGTAIDLNWRGHPFRVRGSLNPAQMAALEEMERFYEKAVFWAGRWDDPADEMHSQVGYNTFDRATGQPKAWVTDFIKRKIRPDGFSTFRRGAMPETPNAAQVLADATGLPLARAAQILPTVQDGLRLSECNTERRIATWLAQVGHESDNFNATEEYDSGDESTDRWKYKGRTWIQVTWRSNYAGFSQWAHDHDLLGSPTYFVDHPKELADLYWAGIGPAWYWTVARPDINKLCDAGDFDTVTYRINGGQNGATDRRQRYTRAKAQGGRLLAILDNAAGDDMAQVPQEQWDRVYRELTQEHESTSGYRTPGEGKIGTWCTIDRNKDKMGHEEYVEASAVELGDFDSIERIIRSARGEGADTSPAFIRRAQAALQRIETLNQPALAAYLASKGVDVA